MKENENIMGTRKVFPLLMSMAIPPMVSMLIQSMYNIVDSIFVAKIGEEALTAVSLAFPLQNMILAIAVGLGVGVNSCMARGLGAGDQEQVNDTAAHGLIFTGIHAILFIFCGLLFIKPFLHMFTDDPEVFQWACQYSYIVVILCFGSLFHITIEKMFQAFGNMVVPMILQAIGAVINIILDPIMIFGLLGVPAMGVKGAAIATVIGQMSACLIAILLFVKKHKGLSIKWSEFKFKASISKSIYGVAIPSTIMMALPSVLVGILNGILSAISQTAVAVFGLYFKMQTFVYMPTSGLVQGLRPIISYNYGAGLYDRMKQTMKWGIITAAVIMTIGTVFFIAAPGVIMGMFSADNKMMDLGIPALRVISCGFIVSSAGVIFSGAFEALGKGFHSLVITLLRQLIIIVALSLVLKDSLGLLGIWITFPIAELCASIVSLLLWKKTINKEKMDHIAG